MRINCATATIFSASFKEFLDIQATIMCGFTLKRVADMTRTYSHNKINFTFRNYVNSDR